MSLGIGAFCKLIAQDDETAIYEYGSYNLDDPNNKNKDRIADGMITIKKSSLIEPDIHDRIKRLPNGKKKRIIKRVPNDIPLANLFNSKSVIVENCSHCWKINDVGIDVMACSTVWKIFMEYQEKGCLPEHLSINK